MACEIAFAEQPPETRVVRLLLGNARDGEPAIIVAGIEKAIVRQREYLFMYGAIEIGTAALLEIGAPAAADEERIPCKRHALVVEHVSEASVRVAGRGAHFQPPLAEFNPVALAQVAIRTFRPAFRRDGDAASPPLLQQPRAGHVIGMDMCLQCPLQRETQFADQRRIAPHLLKDGVDQHGLARARISQKIGVGG